MHKIFSSTSTIEENYKFEHIEKNTEWLLSLISVDFYFFLEKVSNFGTTIPPTKTIKRTMIGSL